MNGPRALLLLAAALLFAPAAGAQARADEDPCRADRADLWTRTRFPGAAAYCRALGEAEGLLAREEAAGARGRVAAAEQALPGQPRAELLEGRALLRLGRAAEGMKALTHARQTAPGLFGPAEELDVARGALATGDRDGAAQAYRALLPRADRLGEDTRRLALFEAAWNELLRPAGDRSFAARALREVLRDAGPLGHAATATVYLLDRAHDFEAGEGKTLEGRGSGARDDALAAPLVTAALQRVGALGELAALRASAQTGKDAAASWRAWAEAPSHPAVFAPLLVPAKAFKERR